MTATSTCWSPSYPRAWPRPGRPRRLLKAAAPRDRRRRAAAGVPAGSAPRIVGPAERVQAAIRSRARLPPGAPRLQPGDRQAHRAGAGLGQQLEAAPARGGLVQVGVEEVGRVVEALPRTSRRDDQQRLERLGGQELDDERRLSCSTRGRPPGGAGAGPGLVAREALVRRSSRLEPSRPRSGAEHPGVDGRRGTSKAS